MPDARTHRRTLLLLAAAAFVLIVLLLLPVWRGAEEGTGLRVQVLIVDTHGDPIGRAKAQSRYRPGWSAADPQGRVELHDVVLRAGDEPGPAAIEAALQVVAPKHALPWGRHPTVAPDGDGGWTARYELTAFGTLQVALQDTGLPAPRAWAEAVGGAYPAEAIDGAQVARPGQAARYRVYAGAESVRVHVTGAGGVVTRVTEVEAPGPGALRRVDLEVQEADPILGRIVSATDDRPPLIGDLQVFQAGETEAIELPRLRILPAADDKALGRFEVSYAGKEHYRIVPRFRGLEAVPIVARGGTKAAEIVVRATAPWIEATLSRPLEPGENAIVLYRDARGGSMRGTKAQASHAGDVLHFFLPRAGRYLVRLRFPGRAKQPPQQGDAEVDVGETGAHPVTLDVQDRPWGTVEVQVDDPLGKGASVQLSAPEPRSGTLLPGLGDTVTIRHVPAGAVHARVTWRDPKAAVAFLAGTLEAEGTLALETAREEGGSIEIAGGSPSRDVLRLAWSPGASPYGLAPGFLELAADAGGTLWRTSARLKPGAYEVRATRGDEDTIDLAFEIRAGVTTTVPWPGSAR